MSGDGPGPEVPGIDLERANAARMYDYFLGGAQNVAVDRELADRVIGADPTVVPAARAMRSFLRRVVLCCVEAGIDQFLDLGSGIPTAGNVHEVARRLVPDARVAYVDHEAVAVHHSRTLLADVPGVGVTRADLTDPASVLGARSVTEVIDLDRPTAVLTLAVLHFVPGDVTTLLTTYREHLVPGSALAVSHASTDWDDAALATRMADRAAFYRDSAQPLQLRSRSTIASFFSGLELVEPGLVDVTRWRPDEADAAAAGAYGGVGIVPGGHGG